MSDQTPDVPPPSLPPTHQSTYESTSYESPGYQAATYPSPTYESLTTLTPPTTPTTPTRRSSGVVAMLVLLLGAVVVLGGAGAGVYALSRWVGDQQAAGGPGGPLSADDPAARAVAPLISVVGFEQLLEALEKENGSTNVVDLTLYPSYASVVVMLPGEKSRTRTLYFDGSIRETNVGSTTDAELDLEQVDPELLVSLSKKARKIVDDPNQWYLILGAPRPDGSVIYAYASNQYGEGGFVSARLNGKIVNRVTW